MPAACAPVRPARAWLAVFLLAFLYVISFVDRLILALMIDPIKAELDVSDIQMGLLIGSSFAVFYTLAGIPLARIADKGDRRLVIVAGAVTWGLTTVGCAFADSFAILLLCRIGVGLGEAALVPAALSLIADLFEREKRALPTSIFVTIGACGAAGAMVVGGLVLRWAATADVSFLPILAEMAPWRLTLILVGLPAIVAAGAILVLVDEPARTEPATRESMAFRALAGHVADHRRTYAGFFAAATITSVINYSLFAWFPAHLIRSFAVSSPSAGLLFGGIGMAATLAGGLAIPYLASGLANRGYADANMRVSMGCAGLAAPFIAVSLLSTDLDLALMCLAPAIFLQLGAAVLFVASSPLLSPGIYRAQMAALFFLFVNLLGFGAGPPLVALIGESLFTGPRAVANALTVLVAVLVPAQLAVLWWSLAAFAQSCKAAAEDERAPQGQPASMPPSITNSAPEQ